MHVLDRTSCTVCPSHVQHHHHHQFHHHHRGGRQAMASRGPVHDIHLVRIDSDSLQDGPQACGHTRRESRVSEGSPAAWCSTRPAPAALSCSTALAPAPPLSNGRVKTPRGAAIAPVSETLALPAAAASGPVSRWCCYYRRLLRCAESAAGLLSTLIRRRPMATLIRRLAIPKLTVRSPETRRAFPFPPPSPSKSARGKARRSLAPASNPPLRRCDGQKVGAPRLPIGCAGGLLGQSYRRIHPAGVEIPR